LIARTPRLEDFDYALPAERIALRPARPRDAARLLVVGDGMRDRTVADLAELARPGDLWVVNDTKVIPARLAGRRGAARIEATLLAPIGPDRWSALARPGKRLKTGQIVVFDGFEARVVEKRAGGEVVLAFDRTGSELTKAIERAGEMPLPPYIASKRPADVADRDDYQTLFARHPGAVAAPTAGLHFTPRLKSAIERQGARLAEVTLHVGAGTFLPVKSEDLAGHKLHAERFAISPETAAAVRAAKAGGGRVVAVGTTVLRALESAVDGAGSVVAGAGDTALFVRPGFSFKVVDRLVTNFHLPRSTLLMLVAAFAGRERILAAYAHALERGYRFYSYGDACWLEPEWNSG